MKLRLFFGFVFLLLAGSRASAQEYFFIRHFHVDIQLEKNADIKVSEKIDVHFLEPRHGIFRKIPYRYPLSALGDSVEKANTDWVFNGYRYTKIKGIGVKNFKFEKEEDGDYISVRIGSPDEYVEGDQTYEISYTVTGAINFFEHYSELYFNLIGNEWDVKIDSATFSIHFFEPLPDINQWFVATGKAGSKENNTLSAWKDRQTFEGHSIQPLNPGEGITAGVRMPAGYLKKPDYKLMGIWWMLLPVMVFVLLFRAWRKWGKDLPVTVQTEYYPPEEISPSVAGYIIDGRLNRRDLTALIPFWGAGGYIQVKEVVSKKLLGLIHNTTYEFIKLKDLDPGAQEFEKTMFNGLFATKDTVVLDDLKNSFYITMNKAKTDLEEKISTEEYYTTHSRAIPLLYIILGLIMLIPSLLPMLIFYPVDFLKWLSLPLCTLPFFIFAPLMPRKTVRGTELYQKLLGFREFIKTVEKDRLQEFLRQDSNYFDKVLPFAIVFGVADKWKDKLEGLEIPPPAWYVGNYTDHGFNTMGFMNSLDRSMNAMSSTFYSSPPSSGSSGGSFGGGGSSGGGFGGGGGGSW